MTLVNAILVRAGDLGKLIVATGFEKLSKVQLIAQSGLTGSRVSIEIIDFAGYKLNFQINLVLKFETMASTSFSLSLLLKSSRERRSRSRRRRVKDWQPAPTQSSRPTTTTPTPTRRIALKLFPYLHTLHVHDIFSRRSLSSYCCCEVNGLGIVASINVARVKPYV